MALAWKLLHFSLVGGQRAALTVKQIRVTLPDDLVERLHPTVKERDKRIRVALEEYLSIPLLDPGAAKPSVRARRRSSG